MSSLKRNVLPFVAFAALAVLPAVSMADGGGDYDFPASNVTSAPAAQSHTPSCSEATRTATFNRQMQLSDGDVTPGITMPAECNRARLAKAADDDENQYPREWGLVEGK